MADRKVYLREWRKKRHLTQSQVVDRLAVHEDPLIPRTTASLSRIENGAQPYSQRILEALADIYECEPGELLSRDPFKEGAVYDLVRLLDEKKLKRALAIMDAIDRDEDAAKLA